MRNKSWGMRLGTALFAGALGAGFCFPAAGAAGDAGESAKSEVAFTYGMRAFNHGDYKEALVRFEEAVRLDPEDGAARYLLGLTRFKIGDAQGAIGDMEASLRLKRGAPLDRVRVLSALGEAQLGAGDAAAAEKVLKEALVESPDDPMALYLHGLALARLGQAEEGRSEAERARGIDSTLPVVPEISVAPGTTGGLVGAAHLPFWEIRLGETVGRDSNPAVLSDELTPFDPDTGAPVDRSDEGSNLDLRLEIHPFYDRGGWSLGLRLDGYQSFHQDLDFLDLGQARGVFQLAWGRDPLGYVNGPMGYTRVPSGESRVSFLLQGGTAYSELDGDSFVRTQEAAGSVTIREGKKTATQVDLDYQEFNFFQVDINPFLTGEILNGHQTTLEASQYLYGARRDRYLRLAVLAGEIRRSSTFFGGSIREGIVELSLPVHSRLMLYLSGSRRRDDLDENSSPHKEETTSAAAALLWAFADDWYLTARGAKIRHDAGDPPLDLLDYDRTLVTVGVTWYH